MWQNLMFKLNTMLDDNAKLNEGLLDLNQGYGVKFVYSMYLNNNFLFSSKTNSRFELLSRRLVLVYIHFL